MSTVSSAPAAQAAPPHVLQHFAEITLLPPRSLLRRAITAAWRLPETDAVPPLVDAARLADGVAERSHALALDLTRKLRRRKHGPGRPGPPPAPQQALALSSRGGVALLCPTDGLPGLSSSAPAPSSG